MCIYVHLFIYYVYVIVYYVYCNEVFGHEKNFFNIFDFYVVRFIYIVFLFYVTCVN